MRKLVFYIVVLGYGCTPKITEAHLEHLNGYWQIENVRFPNGQTKEFGFATTVDYIDLKDKKGYRKKLQAKLDGSFETSNDAEFFELVKKGDIFEMRYINPAYQRTEIVLKITKDGFEVSDQDSLTYIYKRFQPLALEP